VILDERVEHPLIVAGAGRARSGPQATAGGRRPQAGAVSPRTPGHRDHAGPMVPSASLTVPPRPPRRFSPRPSSHTRARQAYLRLLLVALAGVTGLLPLTQAAAHGATVVQGAAVHGGAAAEAGLAPVQPGTDLGSVGAWPLRPRPEVVARFEPPSTRWGAGHRGVDLAGHVGQEVRAAAAGRVSFAGMLAGRGVVVVDHGPTRTTYEPVDPSVPVGDLVRTGAPLGRLTLFGSHCFPRACLHWGLIEGAEHYLDPLSLVGAGPVRLLPLGPTGGGSAQPPALGFGVGPPRGSPALPERSVPVDAGSGPRVRLAVGLP